LDTPGHEAFTSMRMRGAKVTDIVVLVVAADDGVMPQTVEAINHAKSANVPIIVAINKIDSAGSNPDRVKQQLAEYELLADTWGGDVFMVEISALKHQNIDQLLDTILLVAEDLQLKADPGKLAIGTVIESKIDPGRGPVATVIIQTGTLKISSYFVAGAYKGKVRAMFDDKGKAITEAPPSTPVEVLGIDGVPEAGDPFHEVKDEKVAKQYSAKRQEYKRQEAAKKVTKVTLDTLFGAIEDGYVKELNIVIKGDVQGSVEALKDYLEKLSGKNKEVRVAVKHAATGGINERDVSLASVSDAIIIGFNVRANPKAMELAFKENVEIRRYNVIYDAVEDIKAAMEGLLSPEKKEEVVGQLEIRETYKISKIGTIAGCYVTNGYINRNSKVRIIRDDIVVYTGTISSLKRFKDDVSEVKEGFECGLSVDKYNDIKVNDIIEVFEIREFARKL
jgi:translation initiation factor IF-2